MVVRKVFCDMKEGNFEFTLEKTFTEEDGAKTTLHITKKNEILTSFVKDGFVNLEIFTMPISRLFIAGGYKGFDYEVKNYEKVGKSRNYWERQFIIYKDGEKIYEVVWLGKYSEENLIDQAHFVIDEYVIL